MTERVTSTAMIELLSHFRSGSQAQSQLDRYLCCMQRVTSGTCGCLQQHHGRSLPTYHLTQSIVYILMLTAANSAVVCWFP